MSHHFLNVFLCLYMFIVAYAVLKISFYRSWNGTKIQISVSISYITLHYIDLYSSFCIIPLIWCTVMHLLAQVTFLLLMRYFRPGAFVMIEQPSSSWLFKQVCFQEVIRRFHLKKHLTHLGLWGHDLLKATHLMTNIPSLKAIETKATADMKQKHRKRVARKRAAAKAAGKPVRCYYKQLPGGRFQGGPDLSSSAVYPLAAVYKCWLDRCTFWV